MHARHQQLVAGAWRLRRLVLVRDAMPVPLLAMVFAQQLSCTRIQPTHDLAVPMHFSATADPAGRSTVGFFSANMAATWRLVAPRFEVWVHSASQESG
jgi:hypothetical protein